MSDKIYYSEENDKTDLDKYSNLVTATFYPNHIEATGVSYIRHFKTVPEIKQEMEDLKNKNYSKEVYHKKLEKLQQELDARKRHITSRVRKSTVKTDNPQSLKRTQRRMMSYFQYNFPSFTLASVLTYKNKVYDMKIAKDNFKKFIRKFNRKFKNAVWMAVYEFHEDGSIHIHFIFRNARGATCDVLTNMWGHGFVFIKEMDINAFAYFCKKERLEMYPSGTRLFSKSANCKKPPTYTMSVDEFNHLTQNMDCIYSKAKTLYIKTPTENKIANHFIYKKFKRRKED